MSYQDVILILIAALLSWASHNVNLQYNYSCPSYCATNHLHLSRGLEVPLDEFHKVSILDTVLVDNDSVEVVAPEARIDSIGWSTRPN